MHLPTDGQAQGSGCACVWSMCDRWTGTSYPILRYLLTAYHAEGIEGFDKDKKADTVHLLTSGLTGYSSSYFKAVLRVTCRLSE